MTATPIVIRFVMASPVILSDGASLDAVATFQGFARGEDGVQLLNQLFVRNGSVHCASWLFPETEYIVDRAEFVRLQRTGTALNTRTLLPPRGQTDAFRVDNKRGIAANKRTTMTTIATPAIWAFATGDLSAIAKMLSDVSSIGIKRANGFGRVQRIDISRAEGWPGFGKLMRDGSPARAIPVDECQAVTKRGAYVLGFPRWSAAPEQCAIPTRKTVDPTIFAELVPAAELEFS
ncbi:hypothetical protein G5V57_23200 [Nordella sp. HKS 07]|uniref:hypothetical protein n=1 Tax=Nordella sp. HKS 07 TaxID=2712222 RepID=UPI0013E11031|nr:hypothetical protein [Nordella sp. HKS 07]QIG50379.1 hypothetical protein G5V57_23200 [Nordella sp. HKS 07]